MAGYVTNNAWTNNQAGADFANPAVVMNVNPTAGNRLVAYFQMSGDQTGNASISDNNSNTWLTIFNIYSAGQTVTHFLATVKSYSGSGSCTVTGSSSASHGGITVAELSGYDTSETSNGTPISAGGSSSNPDAGSLTTNAKTVRFTISEHSASGALTAGTDFTINIADVAFTAGMQRTGIEDYFAAPSGAHEHNFGSSKDFWYALGFAFKEAPVVGTAQLLMGQICL